MTVEDTKYYVYAHYRKSDNKVFYVGKGHGRRYKRVGKTQRSNLWSKIAKKHGYYHKIWAENLTEQQAFDMEKEWIALYGRINIKTGFLANLTEGGEGASGRIATEEQIKAQKERYTEEYREKLRIAHLGYVMPEEQKEKIAAGHKNKPKSVQHSRNVGLAHIRKVIAAGKLPGAVFNKTVNCWVARTTFDGQFYHLGCYQTAEEAHEVWCEFRRKNELPTA